MRKNFFIIFFITFIIFSGCDESFSPYTEFKERFSLISVLDDQSNTQSVVLSKNYLNDKEKDLSFLSRANIRVWYKDTVYFFNDSVATLSEITDKDLNSLVFFNKSFPLIEQNEKIEIEAQLPNRLLLHSETRTPGDFKILGTSDYQIPKEITDTEIRFVWEGDNFAYYNVKLSFIYLHNNKTYRKYIPFRYDYNGEPVEEVMRNYPNVTYTMENVSKALAEISGGDDNKESYYIGSRLSLEIQYCNPSLSAYLNTTSGNLDDLTVRVDASDFSNIDKGIGLFGALVSKDYSPFFSAEYIASFGYNVWH